MIHLALEVDFAEVQRGVLVAHNLRATVPDFELLSELLAILSSEVELARVQRRNLERAHGRTPVVRLPGP